MALNVTQVNQAFLGLLGRPATGAEAAKFAGQLDVSALAATLLSDASFKDQLSVETLSFKTVDLLNTDPAAFVESLYTALLGRASDAEGKAFWLSVAGATPNRADVVSQFIAAVKAQEGTADANAFATIQAEDKALASAWVESLYNNLAGRASDAEGLDFWTNAIVSFTMTPAQVAASFAAALALQGNTTEDGQNYLAKQGIADNFTASFKDFSTLITANEKAEALKNLVTMMNGVTKDSQPEQYDEEIKKVADEYQNFKAIQFTTRDDDNLGVDPETGEVNTTSGVNFTGTYNLTDPEKGTIQSSDSITGNEKYLTDTLTVNVTGYDKNTYDTFELNNLPSNSSVEKLIINNGAAAVTGNVSSDFEYINVNGTGSFSIAATTSNTNGFKDISLNSAATKEGEAGNYFSSNNQAVQSIKTGAGDDNLVLGAVSKSFDTGAGKDDVVAILNKGATGNLGAGDDKFTGSLVTKSSLNAGAGDDSLTITDVIAQAKFNKDGSLKTPTASIEIDGGTGTDTLDLSNAFGLFSTTGITQTGIDAINGDARGIKSIKNVEKIIVNDNNKLYASAVSGQKIELSAASGYNGKLTLDASGATTVDLSKFSNADGSEVAIVVENVKSGNVNLETGDKNFNAIKETIILTKDALKVNIKGFEKANDHIEIAGVRNSGTTIDTPDTPATSPKAEKLLADNMYAIDIKAKITNKTDINQTLINAGYYKLDGEKKVVDTGLQENDEFFIIAYDTSDVENKNSNAKVFKYKVGKDGSVGKVDQMASINVADKKVIDINEDVTTNPDYKVTAEPTVDGTGVATVTINTAALGDASGVKVPLHTPVTSLNLGTTAIGDAAKPLAIEITGLKAKTGIDQVPVTIPNNSVISTLSFTDSTPVKVDTVSDGKTIKIDNIITGSGKDEIKVDATKTKVINAGAGDDKIDLTGTTGTDVTLTHIDGGTGTDALLISGSAAEGLIDMKNIQNINVFGTKISAKAINSNNISSVTVSNTKASGDADLEIVAKEEDTRINLTSLVKGKNTDSTNANGEMTLSVSGLTSKDIVDLSKGSGDKAFIETVKIATKVTDITVNNISEGDQVSGADISSITGAGAKSGFQALKGESVAVTANHAYYTTSAISSGDYTDLSSGDKVLVAVNSGNASTLHLITKTTNGIDDVVIAKVDDTINGADTVASGLITFSKGQEPQPSVDPVNVLTFDNASGTITLAANGTYKDAKIDNTKTAISINGVDGAITLNGDKGSIAKVNIFATKADAVVTDSASIGNGNYNLYIGGSTTKADASVTTPGNIDGNAITLTSTQLTDAIAENVIINTTDKVSFADTAALNSHKLDLSKVGANVEITTAVKATGSKVAVSDFFKASSVSGDDSIKFIVDIASNDTVEATAGKDTISWNTGTIAAHKLDLTNDNAVDTVDLTGLKQGSSVDVTKLVTLENIGKATSAKDLLKVSATTVTVAKTDVSTKGSTLKATLEKGIEDNTANKAYLIIVNDTSTTTDNGTYLVYNSNADKSISQNDIVVKLSGVYTNIAAGTDGFVTLA